MSTFTLLPAMKAEDVNLMSVTPGISLLQHQLIVDSSMVGGALMVIVGILYLVLEDFVLSDFGWSEKPRSSRNHVSRTLVGIQVGLILLSIIITRSSALSLQAKQGLPRGNQVMGWAVLGEFCPRA